MVNIGKDIKRLRKENKIKQSELCKMIGISRGRLSQIENDAGNTTIKILDDMAKGFGKRLLVVFIDMD